jgi:hypothetical protein
MLLDLQICQHTHLTIAVFTHHMITPVLQNVETVQWMSMKRVD